MQPESNLQKLLASMQPELKPGVFVFSTISCDDFKSAQNEALGWFREPEGITLILERTTAITAGLETTYPSRMISLVVNSSLEAVGFLAVITERLAAAGISVNAISAYYHDHLFVPLEKADQAMLILQCIMQESASNSHNQLTTLDQDLS